jgi:hypothetical protein
MTYFVDIFSIDTYEEFTNTDKSIAGFNPKRKAWVSKIKPGDRIICYLKGLSCWFGLLEVTGEMYEENQAAIVEEYSLLFPVKPLVWLAKGSLIPIKRPEIWSSLSFTKHILPGAGGWNAYLRSSGTRLPEDDGQLLEAILFQQQANPIPDGITADDWSKYKDYKILVHGKEVAVQIPGPETEDGAAENEALPAEPLPGQTRTSHKMQALLADVGLAMGFDIWIPKADRESVLKEMKEPKLLEKLPHNLLFAEVAMLKTVEQIDVLWLKKNASERAFEVEHTTAVYSGILRMADLLALQPNFHTRLHIVAPEERRKKVFQELLRPAFSIFPQGPLHTLCSYLPYENIIELAANPDLEYMKHDVLDKYEELANEAG